MRDSHSELNQLYQRYQKPIVHYLARLVTQEEAEDLAQEVFTKVAKNLSRFEGRSRYSTWIYRIATNIALDRLRSRRRRSIKIPLMEELDTVQASEGGNHKLQSGPVDQLIGLEMNDCIREQVNKLPLKYRTVMVLSSLDELKNREIAEILDISLNTVKIRLHRGRAMLREILEDECRFYYQPHSGALACDRKIPDPS